LTTGIVHRTFPLRDKREAILVLLAAPPILVGKRGAAFSLRRFLKFVFVPAGARAHVCPKILIAQQKFSMTASGTN
jgi:hypothetical protein